LLLAAGQLQLGLVDEAGFDELLAEGHSLLKGGHGRGAVARL